MRFVFLYVVFSVLVIQVEAQKSAESIQPVSISSEPRNLLMAEWQVSEFDTKRPGKRQQSISAQVPGCIHTDLIRAARIDHPFTGTNEVDCQWVEEKAWIYETLPFSVPSEIFSKSHVSLRFNGLDTYAKVELNGTEVLTSDNAHRFWDVDVKSLLKSEGNVMRIVFESAVERSKEALKALPYPLPGDSMRAVVRKPQFHFGWDWGPRLVTCGITKPIEWIAFDEAHLADVYFEQSQISEQQALLNFQTTITSAVADTLEVRVTSRTSGGTWSESFAALSGANEVSFPIRIQSPQLWWCNGQGRSNLYVFDIELVKNNQVLSRTTKRFGLRDMRLITQPDSIGESFYFQLNGQPVFAKGANYIPMRYFPGEATEADYLKLIMQCKDAHINMLRVWGGGVYEEEVFYDLCDQYGIMIWHDFMFACSMYPGDAAFLENVRIEAEQQVRRLRNHPCIALWCGNNENAEGWERWGWKSGLSESQVEAVQKAYDDVFKKILPNMVSANSRTDYWESSPRLGRGDVRSIDQGDSHYWGVWHDAEPFEVLQAKVPRFMSEFGTQSYPSQEVVEEMMEGDEVSIKDEGIVQHQKHGRGFDLMDMYLNNWYPEVSKDEVALYGAMTQVVQAEGIAMGIEAQRRAMPRCMGTLYWQLNDVWPAFSWSGMDYKGTPKLLHHLLKTVYSPQLISCSLDGDELGVWWISDTRIDTDSMVLDYAIYDGGSFVGQPDAQLRSTDTPYYQSPVMPCRISYGSHRIHAILLEDLGIDTPENMIIEVRISYPGAANPTFKRIQKLIPKSDQAIVPYHTTYKLFDPKTRTSSDESVIMFKKAY